MAQDAALRTASCGGFECTGLRIGVAAYYQAINRESTPRWRGPARIFGVAVTGATVKFQSETSKVLRFCVQKEDEEADAEDVKLDPIQARTRPGEVAPSGDSTLWDPGNAMDADEEKGDTTSGTGTPKDGSHPPPEAIPSPGFPSLSAKAPSSPRASMLYPAPESSFGGICGQSQAPFVSRTLYETLTRDQRHERRSQMGYHRKASKEVSETRLASMGVAKAKRMPVKGGDTDTAETIHGTREWAPVEGFLIPSRGKECRVGDLHLAFVAGKEVVKEHARCWHAETTERRSARNRGRAPARRLFLTVKGLRHLRGLPRNAAVFRGRK